MSAAEQLRLDVIADWVSATPEISPTPLSLLAEATRAAYRAS
jgi:hypothetical protein